MSEQMRHISFDENIYRRPTLKCSIHGRYYEKGDDCPICMVEEGVRKPKEKWKCPRCGSRHDEDIYQCEGKGGCGWLRKWRDGTFVDHTKKEGEDE